MLLEYNTFNRMAVVESSSLMSSVILEIEHEHAFLLGELSRLRELMACISSPENCQLCLSLKRRQCQQGINGFYKEFMEFMRQHFAHEEGAMRQINAPTDIQDAFAQHTNAHTDMMLQLAEAVSSSITQCHGTELAELIEYWLAEHIGTHDALLLEWLGR